MQLQEKCSTRLVLARLSREGNFFFRANISANRASPVKGDSDSCITRIKKSSGPTHAIGPVGDFRMKRSTNVDAHLTKPIISGLAGKLCDNK